MPRLEIANLGPIASASLDFGDLTVLVGPQASGKSIALQMLKLLVDAPQIKSELQRYGMDWSGKLAPFLDIYFGEGMHSLWSASTTQISWDGNSFDLAKIAKPRRSARAEHVFFIPAQRVLALRDGWPRPFTDYLPGDPFVVREFSERIRILVESGLDHAGNLFPQSRRFKEPVRQLLQEHVFSGFNLLVDKSRVQKRLLLHGSDDQSGLPYMVWSAGQREFVPLLLGLYWLMPRAAQTKLRETEWVVLEELEMGLHPRAINSVLLLVFELLRRGYRVCLSTHSTQVLDALWALKFLRENKGTAEQFRALFNYSKDPNMSDLEHRIFEKKIRVYYFDRQGTQDISALSVEDGTSGWGGLAEFGARANEVVAQAVSESQG